MADRNRFTAAEVIPEQASWEFVLTLQKPDGVGGLVPVTLAELATLLLTLYDEASGTIINSVSDVNIKNTGRGTYDATSGKLTVHLAMADNPMLDTAKTEERHVALVEATYNSGQDGFPVEVLFVVRNVTKRP